MEGPVGFEACPNIQSCRWTRRSRYQRLPATSTTTPPWPVSVRAVRLGRRRPAALLGSAAWRFGRLRAVARWWSPLQLLERIVHAYLNSMLPRSLAYCKGGAPPPRLRRAASSKSGEVDYRRGVMLNFCVAEVLRRSSSEVRRSPLRRPRNAARTEC